MQVRLQEDIFYADIDGEMVAFQRMIVDEDGDNEAAVTVEPAESELPYREALEAAGYNVVGTDTVTGNWLVQRQ